MTIEEKIAALESRRDAISDCLRFAEFAHEYTADAEANITAFELKGYEERTQTTRHHLSEASRMLDEMIEEIESEASGIIEDLDVLTGNVDEL